MAMESFLTTELSIFLVGLLAVTLWPIVALQNWLAGIMWSVSLIVLLFGVMFDFPLEYFWLSIVGTLLLIIAGMVVRR